MTMSIVENGKKLESVIDFSKFLYEIKKSWWKIALVVLIVTGASFPFIKGMTAKYVSTATVLIKAQEDNVTQIELVDGYDSTREPYYETQYSLMQSRIILQRAVESLGLDTNPKFDGEEEQDESDAPEDAMDEDELKKWRLNNAIKEVSKNLTVTGVRLTQLVYVSYESSSAEEAATIANGVVKAYIEYTVEQKINKIKKAQEWNHQRLNELKQIMLEQKDEIEKLRQDEGLLTFRGVDGYETEVLGIIINKLADAKDRRLTAKAHFDVVSQYLGSPLEDVITLPEISSHAQVQDLRIALISANKELSALEKRYGPKHDKILAAKSHIQSIQDQTQMVLRELQKGLLKSYQAALSKEQEYDKELSRQKRDFQALAVKRDKYNTLKTDLDKTEDLYKEVYQRTQEQTLISKYYEADSVLYDPAVPAERASKPNKSLLLIMVFMAVLIFCIVCLIIKAALHNTIDSMSQLRSRLGLNPIGEVGKLSIIDNSISESIKLMFHSPELAEFAHGMRTNILLDEAKNQHLTDFKKKKVIAFASAKQGEGRSLLSYLFASSFRFSEKVLLVDMDFRNSSSLTKDLGLEESKGLADLVQMEEPLTIDDVIVELQPNFYFLPKGNLEGSALVMLSSEKIESLVYEVNQSFERVFVDVPEVKQYKDTPIVGQLVDGVIWVVKANDGTSNDILKMVRVLEKYQVEFVGGVINQVTRENMQSEEGYQLIYGSASSLLEDSSSDKPSKKNRIKKKVKKS